MAHIVKSSMKFDGIIKPFNEKEVEKFIKKKQKYISNKNKNKNKNTYYNKDIKKQQDIKETNETYIEEEDTNLKKDGEE